MMRFSIAPTLVLILTFAACGAQPETADNAAPDDELLRTAAEMPADDVHSTAMSEAMGGGMGGALNTDLSLDPSIADAWAAIRVKLVDSESGNEQEFVVELGQVLELGDSGLSLAVQGFVPDFVMDEGGITSRSADPNNPAARVLISEEGSVDYEGWLFAAMPGIHPYPHDRYRVLLIEGVPAGS
jgi:hypothetical protein